MKILMLGWEFPPKISGGLGIASHGLAEGLAEEGQDITFLLPKKAKSQTSKSIKLIDASRITPNLEFWKKEKEHIELLKKIEIGQMLVPYLPPKVFRIEKTIKKVHKTLEDGEEAQLLEHIKLTGTYSESLHAELVKFALLAVQVAHKGKFDVIHAHDWVTFKGGVMASEMTGLPLYVHVHSTEYDRNGNYAQGDIITEERNGLEHATHIFCVSSRTKKGVIDHYQIPEEKISVIPNAVDFVPVNNATKREPNHLAFIGRLTNQKNPQAFVDIARELTNRGYDYTYSIIGGGYLEDQLRNTVKRYNLNDRFTFTGFIDRKKLLTQLPSIDLLVAPSLSEPFGLVILEALLKNIPVVASEGVGIAEFIPSLPEIPTWDSYTFSRVIEELMNDKNYRKSTLTQCKSEASKLSWENSARKIIEAYQKYNKN